MGYGGRFIIPPVQLPNRGVAKTLPLFLVPAAFTAYKLRSVVNYKIDINSK